MKISRSRQQSRAGRSGHSFETLVTLLRGGKTPNLVSREIGKMWLDKSKEDEGRITMMRVVPFNRLRFK